MRRRNDMTRYVRGLIFAGAAAIAVSAYAASGDPKGGVGTEGVPPASTPDKPPAPPGGFPTVVIPLAIGLGLAVGLSSDENDSVSITGTGTATGTGTGT